jgi:hypothetical protein
MAAFVAESEGVCANATAGALIATKTIDRMMNVATWCMLNDTLSPDSRINAGLSDCEASMKERRRCGWMSDAALPNL